MAQHVSYRTLLTRLAGEFHMVAPDYPGFGHSDAPTPKEFSYTFDNIAGVMDHFTEALKLSQYTLYMQDYGGPVGFRMALAHPDRASHEAALRTSLLSLETTRARHVGNDPNPEKYDPDLWTDEYPFLNKSGEADIQSGLLYDYCTFVGSLR